MNRPFSSTSSLSSPRAATAPVPPADRPARHASDARGQGSRPHDGLPQHPAPWRVVLLLPQLASRPLSLRRLWLKTRSQTSQQADRGHAAAHTASEANWWQPRIERWKQHPQRAAAAVVLFTLLIAATVLWSRSPTSPSDTGDSAEWNPPAAWWAGAATSNRPAALHPDAVRSHGAVQHDHHARIASQPHGPTTPNTTHWPEGAASTHDFGHDSHHNHFHNAPFASGAPPALPDAQANTPATGPDPNVPSAKNQASALGSGSLASPSSTQESSLPNSNASSASPEGTGEAAGRHGHGHTGQTDGDAPLLIEPLPTTRTNTPATETGGDRFAPRSDTTARAAAAPNHAGRVPSTAPWPRVAQRPQRSRTSQTPMPHGRPATSPRLSGRRSGLGSSGYRTPGVAEMQGTIAPANPTDDRP